MHLAKGQLGVTQFDGAHDALMGHDGPLPAARRLQGEIAAFAEDVVQTHQHLLQNGVARGACDEQMEFAVLVRTGAAPFDGSPVARERVTQLGHVLPGGVDRRQRGYLRFDETSQFENLAQLLASLFDDLGEGLDEVLFGTAEDVGAVAKATGDDALLFERADGFTQAVPGNAEELGQSTLRGGACRRISAHPRR